MLYTRHSQRQRNRWFIVFVCVLVLSFGISVSLSPSVFAQSRDLSQIDQLFFAGTAVKISCSISTTQLITSAGSFYDSAYWIGITMPNPTLTNNDWTTEEFMQIGWYDLGNGPMAVWATNGPVDSTSYHAQVIQSLTVGSVHHYSISFDGTGWSLALDGTQVKHVSFPYKSRNCHITVCHETIAFPPYDPDLLNSGVVTFADATVNFENEPSYSLFGLPGLNSGVAIQALWMERIDGTHNGISVLSASTVQMGWGLPTNVLFESPFSPQPNSSDSSNQWLDQCLETLTQLLKAYWPLLAIVAVVIIVGCFVLLASRSKKRKHGKH